MMRNRRTQEVKWAGAVLCVALAWGGALAGQVQTHESPAGHAITLDEAIRMAEANEPVFAAAAADARVSALGKRDARAALLPTATYHNQVIYTQPNGQSNRIGQTSNEPSPVFIANNAVREYASQGVFTETLGLGQVGAIRLADASAARAGAELEIARRGLVATVVELFYSVGAQADRLAVAQRALDEADRFVQITGQREAARDAAHADVIKAQIAEQQRTRELSEVKLAAEKARLELGVLLFANPGTVYELAAAGSPPMLPERAAVEDAAGKNNAEMKSALASLQMAKANSYSAKAALMPELSMNVTYGVDAPQLAKNGPDGVKNLGYAGSATLDIPVWDWLTSERKIKASKILEGAAQTQVSATQRRMIANLQEFYAEAATAQAELGSLDRTVMDARESLRLTNLRYASGDGTVFEVVDAQSTVITAETAQLDGRVRYQLALAQLQTLTGSL
jgi:outer membrane protein TolC